MHFSGPGKCIWALPRPCQCQGLVESLQRQRKAFQRKLKDLKKEITFDFSNSEAFLCFLERWQLFHAFCKEQKAECIFQALKNAFGHGSARSDIRLKSC